MNLNLITSNPATDAFEKAEKVALARELQDQKMRMAIGQENERLQTQPTRLRKMEADTSLSETRSQTAKDVAPYAAPKAAAGLRQVNLQNQNAALDTFYKSLDQLNKGDTEGAKEIARRGGHELPDSVINDAQVRTGLTKVSKRAQELYPSRPKDQQAYINSRLDSIRKRIAAGEDAATVWRDNAGEGMYAMPEGAPAPAETTSTFANRFDVLNRQETDAEGKPVVRSYRVDKQTGEPSPLFSDGKDGAVMKPSGVGGGAGGGRKITGTEAIIAELRKESPELTYQEALSIAKRSGQSADVLTLRRESIALSAAKADTNYLTNPMATIEKYRTKYGLGDSAAPVAPAPGPQSSRIVQPNETITRVDSAPAPLPLTQARPGQMAPGNGDRPLNIQAPPLPPNLPQGVQYSWSPARQQFRDELGRIYDKNGVPVS